MKNIFENCFVRNLNESLHPELLKEDALEDALQEETPDENASSSELVDAMSDDPVDTPDLEQQSADMKKIQHTISDFRNKNNDIIMSWINRIDEFADFLNSPTFEGGIKNTIDKGIPNSVFEKIKTSESRSLTRAAKEASSLSQSLRSYINAKTNELKQ